MSAAPGPASPRPAGRRDLGGLLALYRQLDPADPPLPRAEAEAIWARLLALPGTTVFVVEADGLLAATCTLVVVPNLTRGGRSYALIENVVVDAALRGRGLGRAVMHAAIAAAWQAGCYKVMLLTGRRDEAVLRFYEGCGFARGRKTGFDLRRP